MSRTISGTYTSTVTLSSTANNPVTILGTARLTPSATSGSYGALYGASGAGQSWTITNAGVLNDGTNGNGIQIGQGGTYAGASVITNQTGGTITGAYGIRLYNTLASSITNQSGATISSTTSRAVYFNAASTLTNSGIILAPTLNSQEVGVLMENGGVLVNNAGGTISGYEGVVVIGSATLTNAGAIKAVSTSQFAVELGTGGSARLIVDPGAVFVGKVFGGNGTLEMASAASAGTLSATNFTNLTAIKFDAGAKWNLVGSAVTAGNTTSALNGTIQGFTTNDTIDLTGFVAVSDTYASGLLTLTNTASAHSTLHFSGGTFTSGSFNLAADGTGGTFITACYCRGTRILTPAGEVAVEALRIGDKVTTHSGAARPIKWIGRRAYHPRFVAGNAKVLPIRIEAGALGEGVPTRDLMVSPEHALYLDGALVPAGLLVNGATIRQVAAIDRLEYFHIELETHDLLVAEGAPAESYVDCDNRLMFQNSRDFARRYPDASPARWEFCAPRAEEGSAELPGIRAMILARAEALGRITTDPGLHLACDGAVLAPLLVGANRAYRAGAAGEPGGQAGGAVAPCRVYYFRAPAGARSVALLSRRTVPAEAEAASTDHRSLGVAVERMILRGDGDGSRIAIDHDSPFLTDGFHPPEDAHRWTDGRGSLPETLLEWVDGDIFIEVHVAQTGLLYPADPAPAPIDKTKILAPGDEFRGKLVEPRGIEPAGKSLRISVL